MYPTKVSVLPTIVASSLPVGQRCYAGPAGMVSGVRTHSILLTISGTATLAGGPATAIRNAGSLWALVDQIGIEENGSDVVNMSGRMLRQLSQMISARSLSATRLATYANGAVNLRESAKIPFSWPLGVSPTETVFVDKDSQAQSRVFAVFNASTGTTPFLATSAGTVTMSNLQITVEQVYDDLAIPPIYRPRYRQLAEAISGADPDHIMSVKTDRWVRGLILQQDTDVGEVDDIVSQLAFRGDFREYIGPQKVPFADLVRSWSEPKFGGTLTACGIDATAAAPVQPDRNCYFGVTFQEHGRLAQILNPNVDLNLRWVANVATSVTAGATVSRVNTLLMELEKIPGRTSEAKQRFRA